MFHLWYRWLAPLVVVAGSACSRHPVATAVCARPGIPSITAEIRDSRGQPTANGATVTIRNRRGYGAVAEGYGDSLRVGVGESRGGTFDVRVTKPWYKESVVQSVKVPEDECGISKSTRVSVTLSLLPGAPSVRQVVAAPFAYGFGWGNLKAPLVAYVEADPGVSQAVVWSSRDSTVARVTPDGILTSVCRSSSDSTWVVATSAADPSQRDSVQVFVSRDQDPARCPSG